MATPEEPPDQPPVNTMRRANNTPRRESLHIMDTFKRRITTIKIKLKDLWPNPDISEELNV